MMKHFHFAGKFFYVFLLDSFVILRVLALKFVFFTEIKRVFKLYFHLNYKSSLLNLQNGINSGKMELNYYDWMNKNNNLVSLDHLDLKLWKFYKIADFCLEKMFENNKFRKSWLFLGHNYVLLILFINISAFEFV